jgi:hypothetical protein
MKNRLSMPTGTDEKPSWKHMRVQDEGTQIRRETMDWQQKAAALDALAEISIKCRGVGDWYVSQKVDVKDGALLVGRYGNGATPQEAIEDHWRQLVDEIEPTPKYLIARTYSDERMPRRWNGFMWIVVHEPERNAA